MSELNKENIETNMEQYGVDAQLRNNMMAMLDKCEFAQYAPELAQDDMNSIMDEAAALIGDLENVKPSKKQAS